MLALFFDIPSIFFAFGLMYLGAAVLNRAWWHILIVGIVTGLAVRAIFHEPRAPHLQDGLYVASVLVALVHATLAYFSMGLPEFKRKPKQSLPPLQAVGSRSTEDRLAELKDLRDKSLITPEEYEAGRKRVLDGV